MPKKLPRNVTEYFDKGRGRWRLRFRAKGKRTRFFKSMPGTVAFDAELASFRSGDNTYQRSAMRTKPGSMSALIAVYLGSSAFLGLRASTRATYQRILKRFRETYGDLPVASLSRQNVRDILATYADRPAAGNRLLILVRMLMGIALDDGWIATDPTARIKPFKVRVRPFHTWSEDEIEQYDATHPLGSMARLAKDLLLYMAQRRSDVHKLGRQHIARGAFRLRQEKTDELLEIPIHPTLAASIKATKCGNLTFLVTSKGKPFEKGNGFGQWFKRRCIEAGLDHWSTHGGRKGAARRLAEAGRSNQDIKSITGHRTDKEVARYTAAADQKIRAERTYLSLGSPKRERKNGTHVKRGANGG